MATTLPNEVRALIGEENISKHVLHPHPSVENAHLTVERGQALYFVLNSARRCIFDFGHAKLSKEGRRIMQRGADFQQLARERVEDLKELTTMVYTRWDSLAHPECKTIIQYIKATADVNGVPGVDEDIEKNVKYFKTSRVHNDFFALFSREDGTILVEANMPVGGSKRKVYLVQGMANSVADALGCQTHGVVIGQFLKITLLPWDGRIVYDGTMAVSNQQYFDEDPSRKIELFRAYIDAVKNDELILSLPLIQPQAKPVPKSSTTNWRGRLSKELDAIKKAAWIDGKGDMGMSRVGLINDNAVMWVMRRHGYSRAENPEKLITIMASETPILFGAQMSAVIPTIGDLIKILLRGIKSAGNKKPRCVLIDVESLVLEFTDLMKEVDIIVEFYPPPTVEEMALRNELDIGCSVCYARYAPDGGRLLRCGRCKQAKYCSAEHQKLHWKQHKEACRTICANQSSMA